HALALLKLTLRSATRTGTGAPAPSSLQHHNAWVARTLGHAPCVCAAMDRCAHATLQMSVRSTRRGILVRVHTPPRVQRLRLVCADHGCGLALTGGVTCTRGRAAYTHPS